jgi:heptosyltransferase-2
MSVQYKSTCKYFSGESPCAFHKQGGIKCDLCTFFLPRNGIILIIKLGAIGDVVRTTPLLSKIQKENPYTAIWWLTNHPEILPEDIDKVLPFNLESVLTLQATEFSWIINLDKDPHACGLASTLKTEKLSGYVLKDGKPAPANDLALNKYLTGIFDDVSKLNKKSYLQEIFEICGYEFSGEEYSIRSHYSFDNIIPKNGSIAVGLNTGCGERWVSRKWGMAKWEELIKILKKNGYFPVLLGGEKEHVENFEIAKHTNAYYPGFYPLTEFISLVDNCDVVVTSVTMALHIAIARKKKIVLMNNIFNPNEFELYGRGIIIQPEKECKCFYSPICKNEEYFCLDSLSPEAVFKAIEQVLEK